jgi:hypothetical protein
MRIQVNEPEFLDALLDFLGTRVACVTARVSDREVDVSLLGSLSVEAHQLHLELYLRAWEASHPGARATLRPLA